LDVRAFVARSCCRSIWRLDRFRSRISNDKDIKIPSQIDSEIDRTGSIPLYLFFFLFNAANPFGQWNGMVENRTANKERTDIIHKKSFVDFFMGGSNLFVLI
jgi:hypothetical protein